MDKNTNAAVKLKPATLKLKSMKEINHMINVKRTEDMFRFRTCCADPRASK